MLGGFHLITLFLLLLYFLVLFFSVLRIFDVQGDSALLAGSAKFYPLVSGKVSVAFITAFDDFSGVISC